MIAFLRAAFLFFTAWLFWIRYILHDFTSDYKTRLINLNLLPLMHTFKISVIMFFINCLKNSTPSFDINFYVSYSVLQDLTQSSHTITYPLPTDSVIFILIEFVGFRTPCQSSISRHMVVCRAAQEAGAPHREYIYRKKVNVIFTPL